MEQTEKKDSVISEEKTVQESTGNAKSSEVSNEKSDREKSEKKRKKSLPIFISSGLLAVLLLIYGGVAIYYQSHFLPGTRINDMDCSNLNTASAAVLVEQRANTFSLEVTGRDWQADADEERGSDTVLGTIAGTDIGLQMTEAQEGVAYILSQQNPLLWPTALEGEQKIYDLSTGYTFEEESLDNLVKSWEAFQPENISTPEDAYIGEYNGEGYEIVPETKGTELDEAVALEAIKTAILGGAGAVNLDEAECYKKASVTVENEKLQDAWRAVNRWVQSEITYDWNGNEVILAGEQIHGWISLENGEPELNEEAVAEFVAASAKEFDTYGKKRKFTTTLGVELTLPSGAFGWKTDRAAETEELIQLIYQGSVLEKEPVYTVKGGAKGADDIGTSFVEIDLSNQHLYLYVEGELKLESDFVSGDMSKPGRMTPPGVFGLTYKTRNAVLRGDDYETPVSYWMPFNGNVGMHDATWRRNFGGEIFLTNGSHGCVNLPKAKAAEIYEYLSTGFPVICYYY